MSKNILETEWRIHSCDINKSGNPNLWKAYKKLTKKKKMPKDKELFVFKNKTNNKSKQYKKKISLNNIDNGRLHKGKNSGLKTSHQTKLSKSVFTKYHKINKNRESVRRQHMRMFSQRAGKGFKVY